MDKMNRDAIRKTCELVYSDKFGYWVLTEQEIGELYVDAKPEASIQDLANQIQDENLDRVIVNGVIHAHRDDCEFGTITIRNGTLSTWRAK